MLSSAESDPQPASNCSEKSGQRRDDAISLSSSCTSSDATTIVRSILSVSPPTSPSVIPHRATACARDVGQRKAVSGRHCSRYADSRRVLGFGMPVPLQHTLQPGLPNEVLNETPIAQQQRILHLTTDLHSILGSSMFDTTVRHSCAPRLSS
jgi:hypothetical protein